MTTRTPQKLPDDRLVIVDWLDTAADASWQMERKMELAVCLTVGWLVAEDDESVTIAASCNSQGDWSDRTAIPRANIFAMRPLRLWE